MRAQNSQEYGRDPAVTRISERNQPARNSKDRTIYACIGHSRHAHEQLQQLPTAARCESMDNLENNVSAANCIRSETRSSVRVSSASAVPFARLCENNTTVDAKEPGFGVRAPSTSRPCPSRISKFPHNLAQHPDDFSPTAPPTTTTMIDRDATARKTRGSMAGTLRASPFRDSVPSLDSGRPRQLARARARALVRPGRRLGAPGRRSPLRSASGMRKRRESASRPLRTGRASPSA